VEKISMNEETYRNSWKKAHSQGKVKNADCISQLYFLRFRAGQRVLDVGCGAGLLLNNLEKAYGVYGVGIDVVSTKNIKLFVNTSAQQLPFIDQSFDILYSLGVIEHLTKTENAVTEAYRVLRKNGQVYFTVPNQFSLHSFVDRPVRQKLGLWDIGLEKSYSLHKIEQIVLDAGFRDLRHCMIYWNSEQVSPLMKPYVKLDNYLGKISGNWGFFIALHAVK
jgi:SAM-dependent methyltransferase